MLKSVRLLTMLGALLFGPLPAIAAYDCTSLVLDETGKLSQPIDSAVQRLRNAGAEVRVRIIDTYEPHGNLDRYERDFLLSCPAMQSPDGYKKDNLVTLILEMAHRQIGLYYGQDYNGALSDRWKSIKDRTVIPKLQSGNVSDALSEGLVAIATAVTEYETRASAPPMTSVPVEQSRDYTPTYRRDTPSRGNNFSFLWAIASVAGIVMVIVFLVFGIRTLRSWHLRRVELRAARDDLDQAALGVAVALHGDGAESESLDDLLMYASARLDRLSESVAAGDIVLLRSALEKLNDESSELGTEHASLEVKMVTMDESDADVHAAFASEYRELSKRITVLRASIEAFQSELISIEKLIETAEANIAEIDSMAVSSLELVTAVSDQGYRVDTPLQTYESGKAELAKAHDAYVAKELVTMRGLMAEAAKFFGSAVEQAEELPETRDRLVKAVAHIKERVPLVCSKCEEAKTVFTTMSAEFAESSWSPVVAAGSAAEGHIEGAAKRLKDATKQSSMKEQQWTAAEESVTFITASLDEADALLNSIFSMDQSIRHSVELAQPEIDAAEADIKKAWGYIDSFDDDIDESLEDDLRHAENALEDARSELRKKKPDYLMVVRVARDANRMADRIYELSVDQHEAMERKRRLAVSSLSEARDAVITATRYVQNHRGDVKRRAREVLETAHTALGEAEAFDGAFLDEIISAAESAEASANDALRLAKRNVDDEERRRREEQEAIEALARATRRRRTSSSSSSSSSGGFGSSGGSFGGGSFGGGGSSSFGGGSFGGGGSSGW